MAKEDLQTNVRLPKELKGKLERAAADSGRSLTAEIVWRLESTFSASLTHMLIERRLAEFEQLKARETQWRLAIRSFAEQLRALSSAEDPEAERRTIERQHQRASEEHALVEAQLKRIEDEIELLVEELGRRVGNVLEAGGS